MENTCGQGYFKEKKIKDGYVQNDSELASKKLDHLHEGKILDKKFQHEKEMLEANNKFKLLKITKELGVIGILFGNSQNASKNITVFICFLLLIIASIDTFLLYQKNAFCNMFDLWSKIFPILTLSLGYIFGKN